jgi:hypothetical protein
MPLIPRAFRPAVLIRRQALYKGVFGPSTLWKVIAAIVFGKSTLKKLFGKNVQILGTEKLVGGQFVRIESIKPTTRRDRKQARTAL